MNDERPSETARTDEAKTETGQAGKKECRQLFGWTLFFRIAAAVTFYGASAMIAESQGLTKTGAGIAGLYALYLLAGAGHCASIGLPGATAPRLVGCMILALLASSIFTTLGAAMLFTVVPLTIAVICGFRLRYPAQPTNSPG